MILTVFRKISRRTGDQVDKEGVGVNKKDLLVIHKNMYSVKE